MAGDRVSVGGVASSLTGDAANCIYAGRIPHWDRRRNRSMNASPPDDRAAHWQSVYQAKQEKRGQLFQERPQISLDLIEATGMPADAAILDVGGGENRAWSTRFWNKAVRMSHVLDLSSRALEVARQRIGDRARDVKWIVGDATAWQPTERYDIWHDRAAFHFLVEQADRQAYMERLRAALSSGGQVIIGTFAPHGPEKCSGLPVMRHDEQSLAKELGEDFELEEARPPRTSDPGRGNVQHFQFSRFRRR